MSQNLMDTSPGGDTNMGTSQYTSIHTVTKPHKKSGGQFGNPETSVDSVPEVEAAKNAEAGEKTAEKIRYGQSLSENGMGGQTTGSGQANSGDAGSKAQEETEDAVSERQKSGYGGDKDMHREIGA
ncbi:hypothetical protein D6D28_05794 [Aureobasidium pullulans]|uniref:Uncharacterized protein n=1 Tax=Aureobasidium pullulans TaxID=5580 RepID=A0A4S8SG55_AURPU|nr:hypothetical protein D6D28_05794 [Aureobasidium pullulans]